MATFLINTKDDTYQEVLQVTLIVEAKNRQGKFRFEKKPTEGMFETGDFRHQYILPKLEDILVVESLYKKELLNYVLEQRERKVANHRAQTSNIVLTVNRKELFALKDVEELWNVTEEMLKEKISNIEFSILGNGRKHEFVQYGEYLV